MLKKKAFQISNFEFGSSQLEADQLVLELSKDQFSYHKSSELAEVQQSQPLFLDLMGVQEDDTHVTLTYQLTEHLKPMRALQKEEYAVKLAICQQVMRDNILEKTNDYVSIHPSTVFYYPMQTVRYTYRANAVMPREGKWVTVQRYKALILSILTSVSYEICLTDTVSVSRKGNALIQSIAEAQTPLELTEIIDDAYNFVVYAYIQNRTNFTTGFKKKTIYGMLTSAVLVLTAVGVTKYLADQERNEVVAAIESHLVQQENEIQAQNHLLKGDFSQAVQLYQEAGKEAAFLADLYFQNGLYQEALDLDPAYLEPVIQTLYANGEQSRVIDLTLPEEAADLQALLQLEKHIVAYNTEALLNALPFLESEATATRMGEAFLANNHLPGVEKVLEKFSITTLKLELAIRQTEADLAQAEQALSEVKDDDKQKEEKKKVQEHTITELTNRKEALLTQLKQEKKVGDRDG
ncbi:hypothetical protein [Jeotgalibaca caeni]|uniref:hypothetical protein n=1 Tax=Jeotgalibaca caeni TaxID=3028623 RepID=UPI00237DF37C|nr:hypothetical protein [Jeotgalibaca caeni]MDE1548536.1 hypothetical protein [Jeotgalibaca caeni]